MDALRLVVPVDAQCARLLRARLIEFASEWLDEHEDLEEFVTAVSEAFANAVEHACSLSPIFVEIRLDAGDKLVATVTDRGRGFDPYTLRGSLPPAAAERGRGIPLMRRYSDMFAIRSRPGGGTVVTLGRRLHRPRSRTRAAGVGASPRKGIVARLG